MTINLTSMLEAVETVYTQGGFAERYTRHEPKSAPGDGITIATWFNQVRPVARASGLDATSVRLELVTRFHKNMLSDPADEIDPDVYAGVEYLLATYTSGFTLNGAVNQVDLLGAYGDPLMARAGFLNQGGSLYRVVDVICPLIIFDAWTQAA